MGNRAVITTNKNLEETGLYLHWNGGRDSVEAFLAYCDLKRYRTPDEDCYGWSYLACVICNTFGDGLSCGVDNCANLDCDNYDNGVYIVKGWRIVDRVYKRYGEQLEYDLKDAIEQIDSNQPDHMRLTDEERERMDEVIQDVIAHRNQ